MGTRKIFILTALTMALFSFDTINEKNDVNSLLNSKIELVFSDLIMEVKNVIFLEENDNYFYKIEGFKDNKHTSFIIKVSEESYCSKELNTVFVDEIWSKNNIEFCYWKLGMCIPPVDDVAIRCGIYYDGECYPY